ncbi:tetratricopeptide repeat protein [Hyphomicrobium denitrificans]|uniref:tetratricopeptide repeat protein n=1 Tax=Hyphomicrobium denitrificans TaxID=53399 RepID=UPI0011819C44|nr:tetratricopeptide repeat protein [Hyphomicrobium denitrificans]
MARLLARRLGGKWPLIDLRGAEADEARLRMGQCLGQIRSGTAGVILDDLPVQLDAEIEDALSLVFDAARVSDCLVVVTCSRLPSDRLLSFASGDAVVRASNLNEADVGQLVAALGGDAEIWGPVTHTVCGSGNPQLVHARLKRLARQGWPTTDRLAGIDPRLPARGAEDERTAARRRLQNEVDERSRGLLYRLSVIGGYFDRPLALELGKLAPSLTQPGEALDWLIGPWIEDLGRGYYRLSPLLSGAARDVVPALEFRSVQHAIVNNLISRRPMTGNLLSTAFLHAFASAHEPGLMMLAALPITVEESKKRYVAHELMALKYLRIDRPLFDTNPYLSVLLRFAQFHVLVEFEEWKQVNECFAQGIKEAAALEISELGSGFEMIALWAGLSEQRLPERVPNWLQLTLRVKELLRSGKGRVLAEAQARAEQLDDAEGLAMHQALFVMNAIKNPTVASLHSVFKELDDLPAAERNDLLAGFEGKLANFRLFTGNAWFADQKREGFDPKVAALLYADMATRAGRWGKRSLAIDCLVAHSVILDEYGLDERAAMTVLDEGERCFGPHIELTRQRAKVLHRAGRNEEASKLYAAIAEQLPPDDLVEQAFAMREAAISAARLGNWSSSIDYYRRAIDAASRGGDEMTIMATGLLADLAWAQANHGHVENAVSTLKEALARIEPYHLDRSDLEHCARLLVGGVVGNIDQWLSAVDEAGRKKFEVSLGICSRLEPIEALQGRKPHPIEVDWYKLALLELRHTEKGSITKEIDGWPSERRILNCESLMAKERIEQSVRRLDLSRFVQELKPYAASMLALRDAAGKPGNGNRLLARGRLRELVAADYSDAIVVSSIQNAVIAFAVQAVCNKQGQLLAELGQQLSSTLSDVPAFGPLVDALSGRSMINDGSQVLITSRLALLATRREKLSPSQLLEAQCRIVDSTRQNELKGAVSASVGRWVVETWREMTTARRFELRMPMRTCLAIEQACESTEGGLGLAAKILLAAEAATRQELSPEFRDFLARL